MRGSGRLGRAPGALPDPAEAARLEHALLPKLSGLAQANAPGPTRQRLPSLHVPSHCPSRTTRPSAVRFFCFGGRGRGLGRAGAASARAAFRFFDFFSSRSNSLLRACNALGQPALTRFFRFSR